LQGFYKPGIPCFIRLFGGVFFLPAAQKMVIVGQHPEAVPLHALKFLFLRFPPQAWPYGLLPGVPPVLIGDGEVLCQHECGFFTADTVEPGNKVNHVPGGSAAETVKAAVNLHAWVLIVMEWTDAHPIPVYFDSVTLRSLPCGDGLFHGFKYVQ
jgi:hypothetical protein